MNEEIKILCVDDEPNVLNALRRLFLDDDYTILTSTSGQEGLDILRKEHVQIVISDYRMPSMDGVEFLKEVCELWPDTVRIVLSGYADAAAIVSAINEGRIYKFIPKPWNDEELKVAVSNAIERYFLYKKNLELTSELQTKNDALQALNCRLEKLLAEKSSHLEFRNEVLVTHQRILDAIPVGILGVDMDNMVVLCNSVWGSITGDECRMLGQNIGSFLPEEVVAFVDILKSAPRASADIEINGNHGRILGSRFQHGKEQQGIILAFIHRSILHD